MERNVYDMPAQGKKQIEIHVGHDSVVEVHKYYGPMCADGMRITLDFDAGDWVVEREGGKGEEEWLEKARWNCQESF